MLHHSIGQKVDDAWKSDYRKLIKEKEDIERHVRQIEQCIDGVNWGKVPFNIINYRPELKPELKDKTLFMLSSDYHLGHNSHKTVEHMHQVAKHAATSEEKNIIWLDG